MPPWSVQSRGELHLIVLARGLGFDRDPDEVLLHGAAAEALFAAVCERGLEGVVAKRQRDPYWPGDRSWVKTKNRATARFAEERDCVGRGRVKATAKLAT